MFPILRTVLVVTAALIAAPVNPANAATSYCVGTPGQLQDALDDAEVDGDDSIVKLRSGTYSLGSEVVYETAMQSIIPAGALTIRGGYNSDCSSYSLTPGATTLNGSGAHALYLYSAGGSIKVLGVTLQSAGMNITSGVYPPCFAPQGEFRIQRVRVDQGDVAVTALCNHVVVANSLFTNATNVSGSAAHPGASSLGVYLLTSDELDRDPAQLTVVNSTLVNGMLHVINCCDGVNRIGLYNSVFHRSSGTEISSEAHVVARNNRYDSLVFAGAGLLLGSSGNTSAAPDLNSSFVPNPGSPLIDAGTATVPDGLASTDLAGNERVIGNQVDMGALESPVDGTGTYVVTNTNASGAGSLAAAVDLANADSGPNRIEFDIDGGLCPRRITLSQSLQVHETLTFDGWSQPGSVQNSSENGFNAVPCVVLDGAGTVPIGIETMGQLATDAGRVIVRGLGFEGFSLAISLAFGEDHRVYGNQFGGHVGGIGGLTLAGNNQAIGLIGGGRSVIGGWSDAERNLISGSSDVGVLVTTFLGGGGSDNEIINNLIGLDKNGASALANGTGIRVNGGNNRIAGNRIGGNSIDGVLISGSKAVGNRLDGNFIGGGLAAGLSIYAGNGRMGVMVQNEAHDNRIGPGNIIGRNGDDGVRIMSTAYGHNRVTANRIDNNDALGIDLGANGVTANDLDPQLCAMETGCAANRGQNFPLLASAVLRTGIHPVGAPIQLQGSLRSLSGTYRVELFGSASCASSGHGQGGRYLGAVDVTIAGGLCQEGNCSKSFSTWLPELDLAVGDVVTAAATSAAGDTSEFSACVQVGEEDDTVTPPGPDALFSDGFED